MKKIRSKSNKKAKQKICTLAEPDFPREPYLSIFNNFIRFFAQSFDYGLRLTLEQKKKVRSAKGIAVLTFFLSIFNGVNC